MGNLGVPTLPPVTTTWHPSTWWEQHGAPRDEEAASHLVRPGDTVIVAHPDGSTTRCHVDIAGRLVDEQRAPELDRRAEVIDLPVYPRAS